MFPTPCAELSRFLPETAILGFSIINLVSRHCLQRPIGRLISVLAVCGQPYMCDIITIERNDRCDRTLNQA